MADGAGSVTRDVRLARFGTDEIEPEPARLWAGPLSADLVSGQLRGVRFDGTEVLRGIAYLVRDRNWGTYAPVLDDVAVEAREDAFRVTYKARCRAAAGETLTYAASITGHADGTLVFDVLATPDGAFETNRCGFCVLHPIVGLAGAPVEIEHVDGTVEHATLPDLIDPWQPFKDIRAITHMARPDLRVRCHLDGDSFEMEDQRNWTDASYKTYVRPLALPWSYTLPAGETQRQTVTLSVSGSAPLRSLHDREGPAPVQVRLDPDRPSGTMPGFGLGVAPEQIEATWAHRDRLADLAPQSLLLHFDPTAGHGLDVLRGFARIAAACAAETVLECVVPGRGDLDAELGAVAELVRTAGLRLDAVAVSPAADRKSTPPGSAWPDCPPLEHVYAAARRAFPGLRLGGGMFAYFTELNRKRPPVDHLDFVTHATCPLVHAADDRSVMESLEAMPFVTRSTRAIIGPKAYRIGPSTIGMRHNPYGSRTMDNPGRGRVAMAEADPRQAGLFGAAWMLGYAARIADAGVEVFTSAALTGPFGLLRPDGATMPVFGAAKALAGLGGRPRLEVASDRDSAIAAVAAMSDDGPVVWLANLTGTIVQVHLTGVPAGGRVSILDESSVAAASDGRMPMPSRLGQSLYLRPFAIARVTA